MATPSSPGSLASNMTHGNEPAIRVIILEDNPADAELMELELQRHGVAAECTVATCAGEFDTLLQHHTPDMVLADHALPGFDGMAALARFREQFPDVPFIFVSGSLGEERATEALKSGATDYVLKDRLQRLSGVVRRAVREHQGARERRQAQRQVEEQGNLLIALIDNLPEDIYTVDAHSRLTAINRAMLRRLKLTRQNTVGKRLSELPELENARNMELQDAMVLNSGNALLEQEHAVETADGRVRWLISSRIPLRDAHGTVIGVVCTERDNTVRKELEQEILEIANREQRRLGSDLHDGLGQELTGLSLMMKGLEVQMEREQSAYLPQVIKLNELIALTIQNTRSLARGLAPVNLERGGIREALKQLAVRCTDVYGLACHIDDQHADISALDEALATEVYRIAQEATTNAARHAQASAIRIELRTTGRRIYLSVTDNGIGIPRPTLKTGEAAAQYAVNGAFGTTQRDYNSGLGMKIMEYRARTMGGHISFERLKKGTRVALSCPLRLPGKGHAHKRASAGQQSR